MDDTNRIAKATQTVVEQLQALNDLVERSVKSEDFESGFERLRRWKSRASDLLSQHVHPKEGAKLREMQKYSFRMGDPIGNLVDEARMYQGFLLALVEDLQQHPAGIIDAPMPATDSPVSSSPKPPESNVVFIIHGHDELNLLRLKEIIRDRWKLEPIVLAKQPGKGRTLIEKFEDEAQRACYAFALLTPDDIVTCKDQAYAQARPNVIFELGWFYGRLGRERVAILFKKGAKIHSDLDGISRIEFAESVDEAVTAIERELVEGGILKA